MREGWIKQLRKSLNRVSTFLAKIVVALLVIWRFTFSHKWPNFPSNHTSLVVLIDCCFFFIIFFQYFSEFSSSASSDWWLIAFWLIVTPISMVMCKLFREWFIYWLNCWPDFDCCYFSNFFCHFLRNFFIQCIIWLAFNYLLIDRFADFNDDVQIIFLLDLFIGLIFWLALNPLLIGFWSADWFWPFVLKYANCRLRIWRPIYREKSSRNPESEIKFCHFPHFYIGIPRVINTHFITNISRCVGTIKAD